MTSLTIGIISAACICGGRWWASRCSGCSLHHLSKDAQDVVKLAVGVIATSTALVLGLLVSSSKGQFDAMGERLVQFGANVIILDETLAEYGPRPSPSAISCARALRRRCSGSGPRSARVGRP